MRTTSKRLLSTVLALIMVFSTLPSPVFAQSDSTVTAQSDFFFWETITVTADATEYDGGKGSCFYRSSSTWVTFDESAQTVRIREQGTRLHTPLLSGDYSLQFDLRFSEDYMDVGNAPQTDEGLYLYPLGMTSPSRLKILLSPNFGVRAGYDSNTNDAGNLIGSLQNAPTTLDRETDYSVKIQKSGNILRFRIWNAASAEPEGWTLELQADYVSDLDTTAQQLVFRGYERPFVDEATSAKTVSGGVSLSNLRFSKPVSYTAQSITIRDAAQVQIEPSEYTAAFFDGAQMPELASPDTMTYEITKGQGLISVSEGKVSGVNGSSAKTGEQAQVCVVWSGADGTMYLPVDVTLYPAAFIGSAAYYNYYLATRKVTDGGTLVLGGAEAGPVCGNAQTNNKTFTVTGTGIFGWDKDMVIAQASEDDEELCGYATSDATLIFRNATVINGNPAGTNCGYIIQHEKNHTDAADKTQAYRGTMQVIDSVVDINSIFVRGTLDVMGQSTQLVVRNRLWIGGNAGTAYVNIKDGATVILYNDTDQGLGKGAAGIMELTNGATFRYECTDGYNIHSTGVLKIDATSLFQAKNGVTMENGAQIILDGSALAEGESRLVLETPGAAGLLAYIVDDETDAYTYTADAAGIYVHRATSGCEHIWQDATCTAPKTCAVCGMTHGEPLDHSWTEATEDTPVTCSVCGLTVGNALGYTYDWEFWKDGFSNKSTGLSYNSNGTAVIETDYAICNSGWGGFVDNGFTIGSTVGINITSKNDISGDYSFQAQVMLDDGKTWTTIWPQYVGVGDGADASYRIELTHEKGIQVGYSNYYRYAGDAVAADKLVDNNTVTAMELKTPYILKWEKKGATLRIKFWKSADAEPAAWNFEITHEGVIDTAAGKFRADYYYDGSSYTPAVTSVFHCEHIQFTKPLTVTVPDVVVDMDAQEQSGYVTPILINNIFGGRQQPELNAAVAYRVTEGESVISVDAATGKVTPITGGRAKVEVTYADAVQSVSCTGIVRVKVSCTAHDRVAATCTDPSYCAVCGETTGTALGHSWTAANCTTPKTCSVCGITAGGALGHQWNEDTGICTVCGDEMKQLRILFFGNSYSQYAAFTMYDLIKTLDYDRLVIANYVKGSTTQDVYWDWISGKEGASTRTYQELIKTSNCTLTEQKTEHTSAEAGLTAHDWDYIVLQSYAPESGRSLSQNEKLASMVDYVKRKATNPDMKLVYPLNWSSSRDIDDNWYSSVMGDTYREAWKRVLDAYDYPEGTSPFSITVPIGTLVEIGRGSYYNEETGTNLTCDGFHLDAVGNYLFVMAYMTALTDRPIDGIGTAVRKMTYADSNDATKRYVLTDSVTDAQAELCKAIVRVAYDAPHDFITYAAVTTANGVMTRYETLAEAAAAAKSGDTIEILQVCKNNTRLDVARGVNVIYYTADGRVTAQLPGGGYIDSTGLHGTFAVDYVLSGGVNATSNPNFYSSEDGTITLAAAEKTGYTFAGWYADAAFTQEVTAIESGSTGNKTFYAKWTANTYTIAFDAGNGSGEMASITAQYDETVTLPANTFTSDDKFFAGWDTDPAAEMPVYGNGAEVKNLSAQNGATVTLYAVWTEEQPAAAYSVSILATLDGSDWETPAKRFDLVSETVTYSDYRGQAIVLPGSYDLYAENGDGTMEDTGADITVTDRNTEVTVDFLTVVFDVNIPGTEQTQWIVLRGVSCDITDVLEQTTAAGTACGLEFIGFAGLTGSSMTVETTAEYLARYAVPTIDDAAVKLSVEELAAGATLPQPDTVAVKLGTVAVSGTWTVNGSKVTGSAVRGSDYVYEATFDLPNGYTMKETAVLPEGWSLSGQKLIRTFHALTAMKQLRLLFIGPDLSESGNEALDRVLSTLEYDKYVIDAVSVDAWNTSDDSIRTALTKERWDYIVLQPNEEEAAASISGNQPITTFAEFVKQQAANPNMKLGFLLNWSTSGEDHTLEAGWKQIADAYDFGENESPFDLVIPVGTAIQNGRRSFWSETTDALLLTDTGKLSNRGAYLYAMTVVRAVTDAQITDIALPDDQVPYADEQLIKALVYATAINPVNQLTYACSNPSTLLFFFQTLEDAANHVKEGEPLELYGICKSSERVDIASSVTVVYYTATGKRTTYLPDGGYIDSTGLHSLSAVVEQAQIGDVKYVTLAEAIEAAAEDGTVTLLTDVTEEVVVSKAVTIVKNGFTAVITAGEGYEVIESEESYVVAEKTAVIAKIVAKSGALELKDMVSICYSFHVIAEEADVAEYGLLIFDNAQSAADPGNYAASETIRLVDIKTTGEKDGETTRVFEGVTAGISARNMGKTQYAVGYLKMVDGTVVYAPVVEYSAVKYCTNMVTTSAETKQLCNALMQYGAAAQVAQDGMTSGLMNEGFEAVAYDEAVLGEEVFSVDTTPTNGFTTKSAQLELKGAISYVVKYAVDEAIASKKLYAEYTVMGESGTVELVLNGDRYEAVIAGISARNMDETIVVKPYYIGENGEKVYGAELVYSGYEYVRRIINNSTNADSIALAKALAMYIDAANTALK